MSKKPKSRLCGHFSPMTLKPCLKPYGHYADEKIVIHQNGAVTWSDRDRAEGFVRPASILDETLTFKGTFDGDTAAFERLFLNHPRSVTVNQVDLSPYVSEITFGSDDIEPPEHQWTPAELLADWWRNKAETEIDMVVDKAIEYGATDLVDIGRNIARLSDRDVTDQEAAMIGVFFYLEGKLARWRSAIHDGRPVSTDTILDIGVYARMAQRITEAGSWPGVELAEVPWSEKKISGEVRP